MKTTPHEKQREKKQEGIKKSKYSGQERQSAEHAGNEYKRFKLFFLRSHLHTNHRQFHHKPENNTFKDHIYILYMH